MNPNETTLPSEENLAGAAGDAVTKARDFAQNAAHDAGEMAHDALVKGEECVRENVFSSVAIAFIGGLILGVALGRREEPSLRKRYFDEPLSNSRDVASSFVNQLACALRDQYGSARAAVQEAADRASDEAGPLLDRASKASRKFKFW